MSSFEIVIFFIGAPCPSSVWPLIGVLNRESHVKVKNSVGWWVAILFIGRKKGVVAKNDAC